MIPLRSTMPPWLAVPAGLLARLLYRVRVIGQAHLPAEGGAVVICNHLSYVDVVVLQMACPRPIRFVAYGGPGTGGLVRWIYDRAGVIEVRKEHPLQWFRSAVAALRKGELLCIFPEGEISRTGQLMQLRSGYEILARKAQVPVIPAAIDGLWGSLFSFSNNTYLWKSPRLMRTPVCVVFGPAMAPGQAGVPAARKALMDLWTTAFEERPVLRRHLGREVIRSLARRPGTVAVVDRTAGRRPVTCAQLIGAAAALSRRLRATVPERRVGIVLPPGAGAIIANLAVVCAGKIPVNLNFTAGRAAVGSSIEVSGLRTVISATAMRDKLPDFPWPDRTVDLRAEIAAAGGKAAMLPWIAAAWVLPNQWVADLLALPKVGDREEAALLFTSGSVGNPRGVILSHRNLLANFSQISSMAILPRKTKLLGCLPIFHSFGFTVTLWYPLLRGCGLVTTPSPLETRAMLDCIREEGVSILIGAPAFIRPILRKARPGELRSLDLVVCGAEKLPEDLRIGFLEAFHLEILQGYGLTETSPVANVNQPDPPVTTATADEQRGKKAGTVGRLLPGISARIVHPETGEELREGETGVLLLKGPNIFSHYLNDTERGKSLLNPGWFATWDLARIDGEGFITVEGRLARFSKIGGEMVPHGTIEQKIADCFCPDASEVQSVVVVGVEDESKGEALVVVTTLGFTAHEVRDRLAAAGLPNLWIPRRVVRVDAIPLLGTGKLDLAACRRIAARRA